MDLRRLRYFIAVAEHLNFRRAAEALETSQPSLSQQILAFERDLGVELFERTKRRVRLTSAGAEMLAGARRAVADFEVGARRAREAQRGIHGTLAIGAAGMVMVDHLPRVVRSYRAAFPDVLLTLTIMRSPDLLDALRSGTIDLAFAGRVAADDGLESRELWRFPSRVVLPIDHRLAASEGVHLAAFSGETLIIHPRRGGTGANGVILSLCREAGFTPGEIREVPEIADLETLIGLVACGLGITILPAPFERFAAPTVVFKPILGLTDAAVISACWRASEKNSPLVQRFVELAATSPAEEAVGSGMVGA